MILFLPLGSTQLKENLATDQGVYMSSDSGDTWSVFALGLPNAPVMQIYCQSNYLYAATFGRGFWRCNLNGIDPFGGLLAEGSSNLEVSKDDSHLNQGKEELARLNVSPNPFSQKATIRFTLPKTQPALLKVYDNNGREITTLFQGKVAAGKAYSFEFRAGEMTSGMYVVQLTAVDKISSIKLVLVK